MAVAMPAGPAAVAVGLSAQARSGGGARVEYLGAAQVEAVVPESGPAAGGSPLRLLGRELPSRGARCRVGGGSGEAWGVAEGGVECVLPAGAPGFALVSLEGSAAGDVVFQYREAAVVRSVAQRAGWVGLGTVFHVAGSNLQASCSVGWESASAAAPAHLVSTALAVCEAAWSEEGPATLRVGGSSEGAGVTFAREPRVAGVAPAVSPEAGGAVLSVAGGEFEDSLRCRLGNVAPVGARWLGAAALDCVSVAMRPGAVRLAVGFGSQAWSSSSAGVLYQATGAVQAVAPESAPAAGGTLLRLTGRDLPSEGAKCLVGGSSSEAWEAGPGELACAAPAGAPGFAAVSLEGWTEGQAVFEYREAAVVRSVAQRAGWAGEGAVFHVAGSNLRASCSVDREPALAHLVSSALAVPAGPAAVGVGLSAQARSAGGARVEYLGAAQVEAVVPESGPAAGGSPLRLLGRELPSRGARCRVGGGSGEAWGVAEGGVECVLPAGAPGFALVSLEGSAAGDVVFQYREAAVVRSV